VSSVRPSSHEVSNEVQRMNWLRFQSNVTLSR
jgi:hypothetical protein